MANKIVFVDKPAVVAMKTLVAGDGFLLDGKLFMRVERCAILSKDTYERNCINLSNGNLFFVGPDVKVVPQDITVEASARGSRE